MQPQSDFNDILENGEVLYGTLKPNALMYGVFVMGQTLTISFFVWFFMMGYLAVNTLSFIFVLPVLLIVIVIIVVLARLGYKNRLYGFSNKRILIRGGIIGVDYKVLEYRSLTAAVVNVSAFDRLLGQGTGTIRFGSPSSPLGGTSSRSSSNPFNFRNISQPYDVLKKIRAVIDSQIVQTQVAQAQLIAPTVAPPVHIQTNVIPESAPPVQPPTAPPPELQV